MNPISPFHEEKQPEPSVLGKRERSSTASVQAARMDNATRRRVQELVGSNDYFYKADLNQHPFLKAQKITPLTSRQIEIGEELLEKRKKTFLLGSFHALYSYNKSILDSDPQLKSDIDKLNLYGPLPPLLELADKVREWINNNQQKMLAVTETQFEKISQNIGNRNWAYFLATFPFIRDRFLQLSPDPLYGRPLGSILNYLRYSSKVRFFVELFFNPIIDAQNRENTLVHFVLNHAESCLKFIEEVLDQDKMSKDYYERFCSFLIDEPFISDKENLARVNHRFFEFGLNQPDKEYQAIAIAAGLYLFLSEKRKKAKRNQPASVTYSFDPIFLRQVQQRLTNCTPEEKETLINRASQYLEVFEKNLEDNYHGTNKPKMQQITDQLVVFRGL